MTLGYRENSDIANFGYRELRITRNVVDGPKDVDVTNFIIFANNTNDYSSKSLEFRKKIRVRKSL